MHGCAAPNAFGECQDMQWSSRSQKQLLYLVVRCLLKMACQLLRSQQGTAQHSPDSCIWLSLLDKDKCLQVRGLPQQRHGPIRHGGDGWWRAGAGLKRRAFPCTACLAICSITAPSGGDLPCHSPLSSLLAVCIHRPCGSCLS